MPTPGEHPRFTIWKMILVVVFMALSFVNAGVDIFAFIVYAKDRKETYSLETMISFIAATTLVRQSSVLWHLEDGQDSRTTILAAFLGATHRYWRLLMAGLKANKSGEPEDFNEVRQRESDACLLSLYSAFLRSAFQAMFQIQVLFEDRDWHISTALSAFFSLVSLFCAVTWYDREVRHYREKASSISWCGVILQVLWRLSSITSRIVAMALTARILNRWILSGTLLVLLILALYVSTLKRMLKLKEKVPYKEEFWHSLAVTAALTFGFIDVYDGQRSKAPFIHSCLMLVLNVLPVWAYVQEKCHGGALLPAYLVEGTVLGGQACGAICMLLYDFYFCFDGPVIILPFRIMHKEQEQDAPRHQNNQRLRVRVGNQTLTVTFPNHRGDGSSATNDQRQRIISFEVIPSTVPSPVTAENRSSDTGTCELGPMKLRLVADNPHLIILEFDRSVATDESDED